MPWKPGSFSLFFSSANYHLRYAFSLNSSKAINDKKKITTSYYTLIMLNAIYKFCFFSHHQIFNYIAIDVVCIVI